MKKIVCLLVLLYSIGVGAQDLFRIVKVVGRVESGKLGREVKTGDRIEVKDALRFTTPASYLIIISPKTGRKVIHSVPDDTPREIFQLLESFVKPEERSTLTRSAGMTYLEEFGNTLAFHTMLILGDGKIPVDTKQLSLSPPAAIKAYYRKGTQGVYRKVSDEKAIYLNKALLFDETAEPPFHRIALDYYKNGNEDPLFNPGLPIAAFVPLFVNESEFKKEITAIADAMGALPAKSVSEEIQKYIISEYGGVHPQNLMDWLQQNKILKE